MCTSKVKSVVPSAWVLQQPALYAKRSRITKCANRVFPKLWVDHVEKKKTLLLNYNTWKRGLSWKWNQKFVLRDKIYGRVLFRSTWFSQPTTLLSWTHRLCHTYPVKQVRLSRARKRSLSLEIYPSWPSKVKIRDSKSDQKVQCFLFICKIDAHT